MRGPPLLDQDTWACGQKRCGNHRQPREQGHQQTTGSLMLVISLLWLSLVLGGVAGSLWIREALRGTWLRMARVPARVRRPVWQSDWGSFRSLADGAAHPRSEEHTSELQSHLNLVCRLLL